MEIIRDVNLLYPPLRTCIQKGISLAAQKGIHIAAFETYRTPERQRALWDQGRDKPGKIVTWTQPWLSRHHYGLACDLAFRGARGWSWEGDVDAVTAIMLPLGLQTLPNDPLHWQWITSIKTEVMFAMSKRNGCLSIWYELNSAAKK